MTIFLDIDGVLNQLQGKYYLDNKCIENLGKLCKKLRATVVLTSSWRFGYSRLGKSTPQIEKLKQMFSEHQIKISGRTADFRNRASEIKHYIQDNNITNYIILDDDITEFKGEKLDNTYIINCKTGLTEKDIKKILKQGGYKHENSGLL